MDAIASQITSFTIVYSTVYSDADQRKHQSSASLAFVRGIYRWPVNSPHKWPITRKIFPFDDVIMPVKYKPTSDFMLCHLQGTDALSISRGIFFFSKELRKEGHFSFVKAFLRSKSEQNVSIIPSVLRSTLDYVRRDCVQMCIVLCSTRVQSIVTLVPHNITYIIECVIIPYFPKCNLINVYKWNPYVCPCVIEILLTHSHTFNQIWAKIYAFRLM